MSQSAASRESGSDRKRAFVEIATSLFFQQGVEATTMQQIARKAGVSYGLFYHYFRAKEDLLTEAVEQMSLLPAFLKYLSCHDKPLENHLIGFAKFYLEELKNHREIVWLVFTESRKRPPLIEHLQSLGRSIEGALADYLEARRGVGEIRSDVDLGAFSCLFASQLFMTHLRTENGECGVSVEQLVRLSLRGVTS